MGSIPFAFSVHHFISSVGADAGFASIIGLAILVLLYFAQARETASLRDQAFHAAQRVQELEGRLGQMERSRAPAPAPAPAGIAASAAGRTAAAAASAQALASPIAAARAGSAVPAAAQATPPPVGAPAGVGAPALAAATRLIPTPAGEGVPQPVASAPAAKSRATAGVTAVGALEPDATTVGAPPPDATAVGAPPPDATAVGAPPPDATAVGAPPPATAAGGANGAPRGRVASPVAAPAPAAPPPRIRIRSGAPPPPARRAHSPLRGGPPRAAPSRIRRALPFLIGAVALAAVVIGLLVLTSGATNSPQSASSTSGSSNAQAPGHRRAAASKPSSVTVAVLNGTAASGLAHRVAVKLGGIGYKQGTIATATDQTRTATVVGFMPGHRRDALAVASALKLGSASVQPVDQSTRAVACPPPAACTATVVVTAGSDLSSTP